MKVHQLIKDIRGEQKAAAPFRLGTIPAGYVSGEPTVIFDGEETASTRTFPVADHVTTLAAGKTVLVAMTGKRGGGIIIAAYTR